MLAGSSAGARMATCRAQAYVCGRYGSNCRVIEGSDCGYTPTGNASCFNSAS